ncbi:TonB-dependent receptor plug domain-containing protein [Winogradskyella sp.]|jgi:iron complex outermembrane receptor protein|uniref:TonB-dependent receptor n=1 Tax=Winogradskyella sp. TaxID=1883156 RepID=UPI0025FA1A32|nr:TonB-dependent receptor plug domain-containing protein [Winogradskyella sp.]MCT4630073.1 TonB-dependent receptor [Winogradskyella sp.]
MRLFAIFIFFICFFTSSAQDCKSIFLGELKDFHNSTPIVGATVFIKNLNKYVTSDVFGKFKIENLCKGELTLEISHVGCETKTVTYIIESDIYKSIALEHHIEELTEVTIAGSSKLEKTSIQQSISKKEIASFTDKSLGDALNTVSGVSSLNTGNTIVKPMIHGLHSSRLLIVNNNVRLFDQEWGDEHAPNIDINSGGRIDVIKGANTLIYGSDAIGGLILIRPQNYTAKDSLFGSTSLSLNSNGLGGNINSELVKTYENGFYARAQASYKVFGDFETADYNLSNSGIKSINASARIGYKSFEKGFDAYYSFVDNTIGILRTSHIGNVGDLVRAIENETPEYIDEFSHHIDNPKQEIIHHLGKVEAYKRFQGLGKLTLQYDFQINRRKEFDLRRGDRKHIPVIDLRLFTTSLQPNLRIDAVDKLTLNTGFLLRYQQNDAISGTGANPLIPDFEKYDAGIYATGSYKLNTLTEISTGFRYDFSRIDAEKRYRIADWDETYNYDELFPEFNTGVIEDSRYITKPEFTFHNISTSLGITKQFNNDFQVLVNYGLASRTPNPSELFSDGLHHSAARLEIGRLTITKEVANKFVASIERNNQNFGFAVSPYYKHINDFIQLIPTGITTTIRGAFPVWEYNQVNARIFGVDIDVNKKISNHFNYTGSLSLLQGDNLSENIPLIHMPSTNFSNAITYKNEKLNQLSIGIKQNTVLQQKRYPNYNFFTFDPVLQDNVYVDISSTPPAYTLFSFNSSANFKVFKNSTLNVAFNVENLFDVSYRNYLNRLRYFADDLGRNFNIKLKLNY